MLIFVVLLWADSTARREKLKMMVDGKQNDKSIGLNTNFADWLLWLRGKKADVELVKGGKSENY